MCKWVYRTWEKQQAIHPFSQQCQSTMTACWLSMPSFYYVYQQACYRKTLKICSRANEQYSPIFPTKKPSSRRSSNPD